jgi:hypothetical protein
MNIHQWCYAEAFDERRAEVQALMDEYPSDIFMVIPRLPAYWDDPAAEGYIPGYSWMNRPAPAQAKTGGHDAQVAIEDWSQLEGILAAWPDWRIPQLFEGARENLAANARGRYTGVHFWYLLYERLWSLRGMENVLCDFYENPEPLGRFMDAITDYNVGVIDRAGRELGVNSVYVTDDIGMQTGPMFGMDIFRRFFKPRYQRMIDAAHRHGMHFWLHMCGNIEPFLEDFIEIGLDVVHPIQKYTMDERKIAARYGGRICFWAGMDLQQILPRGTPEDVRREVRFLIDTFDRPDGGCMITAGNGITADVPTENLRAFFDETYNYGLKHRR